MPKLSVVIPTTLNRAHNTIRVLMSLNKQTADHNDYEVICAMDGGGASSLEGLIAKYNIKLGYKLTCLDSPQTKQDYT